MNKITVYDSDFEWLTKLSSWYKDESTAETVERIVDELKHEMPHDWLAEIDSQPI